MAISEIQLFQILKNKLSDKVAEELGSFVKSEIKTEFDARKEMYATRNDISTVREDTISMKSDLSKSIYIVGLIQFIAMMGSIVAIINFTVK